MEIFLNVFLPILAVSLGIMILTVFFKTVGYISGKIAGPALVKLKGFIKDAALVNVHLNRGETMARVRLVGFTDAASVKGIPYQLRNMVVLENEAGKRILIRANAIRMIEEIA